MALATALRRCGLASFGPMLSLSAMPAFAQLFCSDHDAIIADLLDNFQERRLGYGVASDDAITEVHISEDGTWNVLMTDVKGRSCVIAAGDGWESAIDLVRKSEPRR
ncbi:hypothetical protein [Aminobacter sp. AP02]|uniref:hypothetical protein n=1 Tax=Aminobacter sp. AP02 TaxID=2135737 RepID=UPI000D79D33D|nr:hypothetical protein [Aminobacter sp. AP02]PWK76358.1 hypothetical protein C8K44_102348 [Aminobacter sp. AP02]